MESMGTDCEEVVSLVDCTFHGLHQRVVGIHNGILVVLGLFPGVVILFCMIINGTWDWLIKCRIITIPFA